MLHLSGKKGLCWGGWLMLFMPFVLPAYREPQIVKPPPPRKAPLVRPLRLAGYDLIPVIADYNGWALREDATVPAGKSLSLHVYVIVKGELTQLAECSFSQDGRETRRFQVPPCRDRTCHFDFPVSFPAGPRRLSLQVVGAQDAADDDPGNDVAQVRVNADPAFAYQEDLYVYSAFLGGQPLRPGQTLPLKKDPGNMYEVKAFIYNDRPGTVTDIPFRLLLQGKAVASGAIARVPGRQEQGAGFLLARIEVLPSDSELTLTIQVDPGDTVPEASKANNVFVGVFRTTGDGL